MTDNVGIAVALRAAGFQQVPRLWVPEGHAEQIKKWAEQFGPEVNAIRAKARAETENQPEGETQ